MDRSSFLARLIGPTFVVTVVSQAVFACCKAVVTKPRQ
jgi:hypothetical protein